ncbi:MAG TPA: site-specific DNA-methyltransferase [Polyangiaceae bacterium]|nr:site-specific DNA-methyltransferase [Polyangiaceae bacterium]
MERAAERRVRLQWGGRRAPDVVKAAGPVERVLSAPDGSALYRGNNLDVLRSLSASMRGAVTLAYMDPPFLTGRVHEAVRGRGEERTVEPAFDDRWTDRASYLEALAPRLELIRELLAPHGSVVVHVDPKTSHYVKVLCDEVFGEECFASEIVWRYRRWPSKTPNFQRVHDVLLRYRKSADHAPRFNVLYEPLAASTLATWGTRKQRAVVAPSGRRLRSSSTREATPGVPMGDVWDIGVIAPVARERTGYPSQKPEALLERIVSALSSPGEIVLDPYAGSGTTLAVAARLGRAFVGMDQSSVAIDTACARLRELLLDLARGRASRVP